MKTIREHAQAAPGNFVELDRLEWLDQLDKAVEPKERKPKQMLIDLKLGANGTDAARVNILKEQVLSVCDMEAKSTATPKPVTP